MCLRALDTNSVCAKCVRRNEEFYETYTEPGIVYNRFDAGSFIDLITDMQATVRNEELIADLQQLIDLTRLAQETHEMTYANEIYKILHDMESRMWASTQPIVGRSEHTMACLRSISKTGKINPVENRLA